MQTVRTTKLLVGLKVVAQPGMRQRDDTGHHAHSCSLLLGWVPAYGAADRKGGTTGAACSNCHVSFADCPVAATTQMTVTCVPFNSHVTSTTGARRHKREAHILSQRHVKSASATG